MKDCPDCKQEIIKNSSERCEECQIDKDSHESMMARSGEHRNCIDIASRYDKNGNCVAIFSQWRP